MQPHDWLLLCRTVRFGDTDAAGVMHFHQLLRWCHEAYEESLERYGIDAAAIFPRPGWSTTAENPSSASCTPAPPRVALPILHCRADYLRPLVCGDPLLIHLHPQHLETGCFEVAYRLIRNGASTSPSEVVEVARGLTRHRAIDASSRTPCDLPPEILRWLEDSQDHDLPDRDPDRGRW